MLDYIDEKYIRVHLTANFIMRISKRERDKEKERKVMINNHWRFEFHWRGCNK